METHPVTATPWFIVLAVALSPTFALFIADITGRAFVRICWARPPRGKSVRTGRANGGLQSVETQPDDAAGAAKPPYSGGQCDQR